MRKKLIELLDRAHHNASAAIAGDEGDYFDALAVEADYLLAAGVVVPKAGAFDRKTALAVLKDLSKDLVVGYDLFGNKTLSIKTHKFEAVRKKYLNGKEESNDV